MNQFKKWPAYVVAYLAWIVSFLLWVWFMIKSRETIAGLMARFYLDGSFQSQKVFDFFNQFYFYITGLVWLVLMIVAEQYFRDGVKKGNVYYRICRLLGPELLLLFLFSALSLFYKRLDVFDWVLFFVELVLGAGMTWYARKMKPKPLPIQARANP
jgi:hypothetical protein